MTEELKKAFDFAADATKQLITVATGVITVTVLFSKDIGADSRWWALRAWAALIISVVFGLAVLLNLSGNLQNAANGGTASINSFGIKTFAQIQGGFFLVGIVLVIGFGYVSATSKPPDDAKTAAPPAVTNIVAQAAPPPTKVEMVTSSGHRGARGHACRCVREKPSSKASEAAK